MNMALRVAGASVGLGFSFATMWVAVTAFETGAAVALFGISLSLYGDTFTTGPAGKQDDEK